MYWKSKKVKNKNEEWNPFLISHPLAIIVLAKRQYQRDCYGHDESWWETTLAVMLSPSYSVILRML